MPSRPVFLALLALLACQSGTVRSTNSRLDAYLSGYGKEFQRLNHESALAEWESNTRIVERDSTNSVRTRRANEALARFVGSNENIIRIRGFLQDRDRLSPLQLRQLDAMLYLAAEKPASVAAVVAERIAAERIAAEAAQTETLYGFQFRLNRKPVTANAIDDSLRTSRRLPARLAAWEASKEVGPDRFNRKWWELARQYQGIVPPPPRGERWADGLTKTHVNDDPAQYYDYALSYALLFQLHDHVVRQILHQDPHDTDYYGHREVGDFLNRLMAPGATRPWREVLRETTGRELDGKAMVEYFQPLYIWLQQQNRGRPATLPDL